MTNREKLKEMFPNTIFIYQKEEDKTKAIVCSDEWLDMEYKEPTTKNDVPEINVGKIANGEKILNAFPNAITKIFKNKIFHYIEVEQNDKWIADINMEWWNSVTSQPFINKPCVSSGVCEHDKQNVLDKLRAEIEQDLEQDKIARSVFRYEKINAVKAEQCTGSIAAYHSVIGIIDKYKGESEDKE